MIKQFFSLKVEVRAWIFGLLLGMWFMQAALSLYDEVLYRIYKHEFQQCIDMQLSTCEVGGAHYRIYYKGQYHVDYTS
jgi:hypothetical protein